MKTKVEKLRNVTPQDLVEIYAAKPYEPEAERKVLWAIIYGLVNSAGREAHIDDSEIKDGLRNSDLVKMEKIRFEFNHPLDFYGLKIRLEEGM